MSNIAGTQEETIVDGLGIRFSVYWSGCTHFCPGCHNPETHSFSFGKPYKEVVEEIIEKIGNNLGVLDGVTLSGGDPLNPDNVQDVADFVKRIRENFPKLNIWCYTGYTFNEILNRMKHDQFSDELSYIMDNIDVLVDGPFMKDQKDESLSFRGSANQKIIDVKESLKREFPIELNLDVF